MNSLFWDIIDQENTATFIDDIIVATDIEKEHDKLVEKVLKRLEENDLFIKPENYYWKVKEIKFLDIVIRPQGVEMQKKKMEGVLTWPVTKNLKEVQKFLELTNYYR